MGTNYYKINKLSRQKKDELIDAIENDRLLSIEYYDLEHEEQGISEEDLRTHIGKSSVGWKFRFDHNDWKYFDKSRESIEEFLKDSDIVDEYGEHITPEDFWKKVKAKETVINEDGTIEEAWDDESYEQWERTHNNPNYTIEYPGFYINGLLFGYFSNFA